MSRSTAERVVVEERGRVLPGRVMVKKGQSLKHPMVLTGETFNDMTRWKEVVRRVEWQWLGDKQQRDEVWTKGGRVKKISR